MSVDPYSRPFSEFIDKLKKEMTRKQLSEFNRALRKNKKALKTGRLTYEVSPIAQEDGDYEHS